MPATVISRGGGKCLNNHDAAASFKAVDVVFYEALLLLLQFGP